MTRILPIAVALLLATGAKAGERVDAGLPLSQNLTLARDYCLVHEQYRIALGTNVTTLVFREVPAEADLSSWTLWLRRLPLDVQTWSRADDATPQVSWEGDTWVWKAGETPRPSLVSDRVECQVRSPVAGERVLNLAYLMTGVVWEAKYDTLLRGDLANEQDLIAVDVDVGIDIRNSTKKSFRDAPVRLLSWIEPQRAEETAGSGYFMMDEENPLSDLWMMRPSTSSRQEVYVLPTPVTMGARSSSHEIMARAQRQPARRLYTLRAEDFAQGGEGHTVRLTRWIVFKNEPGRGLGEALPAGEATIYAGALRQTILQTAHFDHTPARGEIRINTGNSDRAVARRRFLGRTSAVSGLAEETYEIEIENKLNSSIAVEIDERPPITLEWSVQKSTVSYRVDGRRVVFSANVEASSTLLLRYVLAIREPEVL